MAQFTGTVISELTTGLEIVNFLKSAKVLGSNMKASSAYLTFFWSVNPQISIYLYSLGKHSLPSTRAAGRVVTIRFALGKQLPLINFMIKLRWFSSLTKLVGSSSNPSKTSRTIRIMQVH